MIARHKFFIGMLLAALLASGTTWALAHGGDPDLIHACVRNFTGLVRIVGPNDNCLPNETPLDWSRQSGQVGNLPPFTCFGCDMQGNLLGDRYMGKDFTNAVIVSSGTFGVNFSGTKFHGALLSGSNFDEANFTNADLSNANMSSSTFGDANFTNANLTSANLTDANLTGANMTGTILTGVIWSNTICPDGTNSDDNSGTCIGHLTP